jgi:hypothetical protein
MQAMMLLRQVKAIYYTTHINVRVVEVVALVCLLVRIFGSIFHRYVEIMPALNLYLYAAAYFLVELMVVFQRNL